MRPGFSLRTVSFVTVISKRTLREQHSRFLFEIFGFDFGSIFTVVLVYVIILVIKLMKIRRAGHLAWIGCRGYVRAGFW